MSPVPSCWLAQFSERPCLGRLTKAHLIPQQTIKRNVAMTPEQSHWILWDERVWVWACGGLTGAGGHHSEFDMKKLRLLAGDLPIGLLEFAHEFGLRWWIEKHYV